MPAWTMPWSWSWTRRGAVRCMQVRYLDGQVVSMKGEKFIVEKEAEWDGGSRGRVKTKGKRGTGWA